MNIVSRRKIWYALSLILIVPGILAIIFWHLPLGIDFRGGTLMDIQYSQSVDKSKISQALAASGVTSVNIQPGVDNSFLLRTQPLNNDTIQKINGELAAVGEGYRQNELSSVGPTMSADLKKKAIIAVIMASIAIIIYIGIAFRRIPKPASSWRFGVSAVLALIHDILFVVGGFVIVSHFLHYEIDSLFITALLTIMGFSVHDTIVVFDRIRENLRKSPSLTFEENTNNSIIQTLNRSLNTSFTVLMVLLALFLLGGETLKPFMLTLLMGIAIGTYSSIFNATPMLVSWQLWSNHRASKKIAS